MQPVLADGGELAAQTAVEIVDDLGVALHELSNSVMSASAVASRAAKANTLESFQTGRLVLIVMGRPTMVDETRISSFRRSEAEPGTHDRVRCHSWVPCSSEESQ